MYVNVDGGVSREHERYPIDVEDEAAVEEEAQHALERIVDRTGVGPFQRMAHCSASSDAAPFHEMGIPTVQAPGTGRRKTSGPSPHLPTDTVDQLDPACLLTATIVGLAFIDAAQRHGLTVSHCQRQ